MIKVVAFDTETVRIAYPDEVNPTLVCISYAEGGEGKVVLPSDEVYVKIRGWLTDSDVHLVGHNVSFDLHVLLKRWPKLLPHVWKALNEGRIHDTMLRERLHLISTLGRAEAAPCSLAALAKRRLHLEMGGKDGEDVWRLNYHKLIDVPLDEWPEDAVLYARKDAEITLDVFIHQESHKMGFGPGSIKGEKVQVAAAFALRGMEIEGIAIDPTEVDELRKLYQAKYAQAVEELKASGIIRVNGTRDQKVLCEHAESWGITERTDSGRISTSRKHLKYVETDSDTYRSYMVYADTMKAVTTFIPQMEVARVHPNYNPIVSTLRTSCRSSNYHKHKGQSYGKVKIRTGDPLPSINFQQIPRGDEFRRCFVPDAGTVFVCADYANLELVCAAQQLYSILGFSEMRDVLNTGVNLHDVTGRAIYNDWFKKDLTYEDYKALLGQGDAEAKMARQAAKPVNLGCPGGQSAKTIQRTAKETYGIEITLSQATAWRNIARSRFSEFDSFFRDVLPQLRSGFTEINGDSVTVYDIEICGIWMARKTYTAASNALLMQSRGAIGKKIAMAKLYRACTDEAAGSILYGCKLKADVHDEFLVQVPDTNANECRKAICDIMISGMQTLCPDMRVEVEAMIQRCWGKSGNDCQTFSKEV